MLISRSELGHKKRASFAWWRMIAWVLLFVAALGCVQYVQHAQQLWRMLQTLPAGDGDIEKARMMLAWDAGYFLVAFVVIVTCAGCILRQAWARPALRLLSLLLAVWMAYRAVLSWDQWRGLANVSGLIAAMGHPTPGQAMQMRHVEAIAMLSTAMGALAVIVLLWLAWQLGQPAVRLQFRARSF